MSDIARPDRFEPIKRIDRRINELEMYFRTRWYFDDQLVTIQKARPRDGAHLVINGLRDDGPLRMKLTTICKPIEHADELGGIQTLHSLKMPQSLARYEKTWKSVDLLVAEVYEPDDQESLIYYLDAQKLLRTVKRTGEADFIRTANKHICREHFRFGISLADLDSEFELIEEVDRIRWKQHMITIELCKLPLPKYMQERRNVRFISHWTGASERTKRRYWSSFKLSPLADQSREVIVTVLKNGREARFPSIRDAVEAMSAESGKKLCRGSFDNVLAGRARSIRTPKGPISVQYADRDVSSRSKR